MDEIEVREGGVRRDEGREQGCGRRVFEDGIEVERHGCAGVDTDIGCVLTDGGAVASTFISNDVGSCL